MATNSHSWQRGEGKLKKPKQPQWDPNCNTRSGTRRQGRSPRGKERERRGGVCLNVQQDLIFIASIFEFYCVRNARYNRSGHKKRLEPCPRRLPNGRTAQMSHTAAREEGEGTEAVGGSDDFWESRVQSR